MLNFRTQTEFPCIHVLGLTDPQQEPPPFITSICSVANKYDDIVSRVTVKSGCLIKEYTDKCRQSNGPTIICLCLC